MAREWRNWSGSLRFVPGEYAEPASEDEVRGLVERARATGRTLRPVGSGHSSSPLVRTDGILIDLRRLDGLLHQDQQRRQATVGAGSRLRDLGEQLYDAGLAMDNLGDIDLQTIAGATATGTHGTGLRFGNLSTQIVAVRLVTGTGDVLDVSATDHPDLLPAVRLSLGALGVLTRITLQLSQVYKLHRRTWCSHVDWTLDNLEQLQRENRNMDFYWYPRSDQTQIRTLNPIGHEPELRPPTPYRESLAEASHLSIPRHRELRFDEIEYLIPSAAFPDCFAELRRRIRDRHRREVGWRILVRTVAADDIYLSGAYGRPTTTIACLQNTSLPHDAYFADVEEVFLQYGGRPHWGKKHSLTARELRPLYPAWDAFAEVRRTLDPDGVFLTPDLARLLEQP
ncbi:D-arabinono-1,4-lactone oxidase [Micromonospora sp. HM5-17]|uniref:D-arabinono-1,4-lactone oxidase n=1 Tax=Micromonospora sp. HM5-17 TaxID=2487710 RepID=UPI000F4AC803|nr:D-arabinono-1,4-lactone oxidase [Micromonospora sp. HM5-17]ROT33696.1 FAD-binding protein [Micromonospora sp. HM5-17]